MKELEIGSIVKFKEGNSKDRNTDEEWELYFISQEYCALRDPKKGTNEKIRSAIGAIPISDLVDTREKLEIGDIVQVYNEEKDPPDVLWEIIAWENSRKTRCILKTVKVTNGKTGTIHTDQRVEILKLYERNKVQDGDVVVFKKSNKHYRPNETWTVTFTAQPYHTLTHDKIGNKLAAIHNDELERHTGKETTMIPTDCKQLSIWINNSEDLSRLIQEMLFNYEFGWAGGNDKKYSHYPDMTWLCLEINSSNDRAISYSQGGISQPIRTVKGSPFNKVIVDPFKEGFASLETWLKGLDKPFEHYAGEYKAVFSDDGSRVKYGCAEISYTDAKKIVAHMEKLKAKSTKS